MFEEQFNLTDKENWLKIGLSVIAFLVMTNLLILNIHLQGIQRARNSEQVKGETTESCSGACLNFIPKKVYIPLGSGTVNTQNVWENTGAQTYINLADYPNIESINWEASLNIPTANGTVHARLINVNDSVEVWGTELSSQGSAFQFVSSGLITLWQGNKLYRVQLKSTMGAEANIVGARIVITLR